MKKNSHVIPLTEQIANVLAVAERLKGRYVIQKRESGQWRSTLGLNPYMSDGGMQPPGPPLFGPITYSSLEHAEETMTKWRAKRPEVERRVVLAEEDAMLTTLYPKTDSEKAMYGEYPKIGALLEKFPLLRGSGEVTDDKNRVETWVNALADDEAVDVALNRKGDGISEDCFITTAGELKTAGYGQLHYERSFSGCVTVFVDTLHMFNRIQREVAA